MARRSKIERILEGWENYFHADNVADSIAKKRAAICSKCPHAVHGSYEKLMPDWTLKEVQGMKCKLCQCPLSTKLRSTNETCDIGKW